MIPKGTPPDGTLVGYPRTPVSEDDAGCHAAQRDERRANGFGGTVAGQVRQQTRVRVPELPYLRR